MDDYTTIKRQLAEAAEHVHAAEAAIKRAAETERACAPAIDDAEASGDTKKSALLRRQQAQARVDGRAAEAALADARATIGGLRPMLFPAGVRELDDQLAAFVAERRRYGSQLEADREAEAAFVVAALQASDLGSELAALAGPTSERLDAQRYDVRGVLEHALRLRHGDGRLRVRVPYPKPWLPLLHELKALRAEGRAA